MSFTFSKELFSVCRVMGVLPVESIHYGRVDQLKFSTATFLYSLALVATQVSMSYYSLVWFCEEFSSESSVTCYATTEFNIKLINVIFLSGAAIVSVISSGRSCPRLIELYQSLQRIDTVLQTGIDQSHMRNWLIFTVIYLIFLISMEYGASLLMGLMTPAYMSVFTLHYTVLAIQLKFLSVVDGIRCRFSLLNHRISEEVTRHRYKGLNKLNLFTVPPDVEEPTETKTYSTVHPTSVQSLSDLHWALCSSIHKTNAIFNSQLLAFMMLLFLQIIIAPYYLFYSMSLYAQGQQSSVFLFHLTAQLLWMLTHFSKLVLLIWSCSLTTQEVNKTAPILCKLLNKETSPYMKKQLETFLLQLLHTSAEFSVFGLFNLQCPILTSIAGAVTTYLVILIQFQNTDGEDTN